jgi:hypothetical protein
VRWGSRGKKIAARKAAADVDWIEFFERKDTTDDITLPINIFRPERVQINAEIGRRVLDLLKFYPGAGAARGFQIREGSGFGMRFLSSA